ncbi:MAG: hypothetical protein ACOH2Q_08985 [Rhodococcus sp. (in: high G+C Gram-positive bacteria)]
MAKDHRSRVARPLRAALHSPHSSTRAATALGKLMNRGVTDPRTPQRGYGAH